MAELLARWLLRRLDAPIADVAAHVFQDDLDGAVRRVGIHFHHNGLQAVERVAVRAQQILAQADLVMRHVGPSLHERYRTPRLNETIAAGIAARFDPRQAVFEKAAREMYPRLQALLPLESWIKRAPRFS